MAWVYQKRSIFWLLWVRHTWRTPGINLVQWEPMVRLEPKWVKKQRSKEAQVRACSQVSLSGPLIPNWMSIFPLGFGQGPHFSPTLLSDFIGSVYSLPLLHCLVFRKTSTLTCVLLLSRRVGFLFILTSSCFPGIYFLNIIITGALRLYIFLLLSL